VPNKWNDASTYEAGGLDPAAAQAAAAMNRTQEQTREVEIAGATLQALGEGGFEDASGEWIDLDSAYDAVTFLAANGHNGAAAMVLQASVQAEGAEDASDMTDMFRQSPSLYAAHLRESAQEAQAQAEAQAAAAREYAVGQSLRQGIDALDGYLGEELTHLANSAAQQLGAKIVERGLPKSEEDLGRYVMESTREAGLVHDRVSEAADAAGAVARAWEKGDEARRLNAREWRARRAEVEAEALESYIDTHPVTPDDVALPATGAELSAAERAKAERRLASETEHRVNVGGMEKRGREAGGRLDIQGRFDAAASDRAEYKKRLVEAEIEAGVPPAIRTSSPALAAELGPDAELVDGR
jgi:hypothetical protein